MSGNVVKTESGTAKANAKSKTKIDRRILRTRDRLGDALIALMQEKPFEEIAVQEVLDRAGVGRSTFYTHYRDKDDLFLSDVEDFFELFGTWLTRKGAGLRRVAPVAEFFAHISESREVYTALVATGKVSDIQALGRGILARSIAARLRLAGLPFDPLEMAARAHALAGSLFALLDWWIDHGMKPGPQEMDALFHRIAWNGLQLST